MLAGPLGSLQGLSDKAHRDSLQGQVPFEAQEEKPFPQVTELVPSPAQPVTPALGRQHREGSFTICMAIPAATPPAIRKAAGKLSRPAPSAAFTTMKTAPSMEVEVEVEAGRGSSAPGLCNSRARSLLSARHSQSPSSLLMPTWL